MIEQGTLTGPPERIDIAKLGPITSQERRRARDEQNRTRRQAWERRLREARETALAEGIHPATSLPLAGDETCGTCDHAFTQGGTANRYWKCDLTATRGPKTDIRKKWPSCSAWKPRAE